MENMTALDTDILTSVGIVQPTEPEPAATPVDNGQVVETTPVETENAAKMPESTEPIANIETPTPTVEELEIEGLGKVKIEDIKEWQRGNLRQSDYTRKTQELAKQREELAEAVEVFNYLRENPQIVQALQTIDEQGVVNQSVMGKTTPENAIIKELFYNQKSMELDMQLTRLKDKYGEFDAVELLNTATALKTDDLEKAYKVANFDKIASNEKAILEKAKAELKAELEHNKQATQTIVTLPSTPVRPTTSTLTPEELRVATGMGVSAEEYAKWKMKK
jgi:hypothetical protein